MDTDETTTFAVHVPQTERIEPASPINTLVPNQHQVSLVAIVLRIQGNPQKTRDGHEIHSFKIADRSGSVTFNVWNKTGELIRPGDILRLQNCISQVFRNELCVKPGRSSLKKRRKVFLDFSSSSFSDGKVTKIGQFMLDFVEEPDMSIVPISMSTDLSANNNTNPKDRMHQKKRPAQLMS